MTSQAAVEEKSQHARCRMKAQSSTSARDHRAIWMRPWRIFRPSAVCASGSAAVLDDHALDLEFVDLLIGVAELAQDCVGLLPDEATWQHRCDVC